MDYTEACPECRRSLFTYYPERDELVCRQCGLIITAPPQYGLVFPGPVLLPRSKRIRMHFLVFRVSLEVSYCI